MNALYWVALAVYSLALLGVLFLYISMILNALDGIRDRWRWHKRRKEIREYVERNRRSQEQLNKLHNPVDDARQSKNSEKCGNPELLVLSFFFGLLLGVLLQGVIA